MRHGSRSAASARSARRCAYAAMATSAARGAVRDVSRAR